MSTGLRAGTNNDGYLQVNGTDVLTALSSGNIGIGTDNAGQKLHISGSTGTNIQVQQTNGSLYLGSSGSTRFGLSSGANVIQSTSVDFAIGSQSGHNLILGTNNTERLRITSDGKVRVPDNGKLTLGTGDDLQIYHNQTHSYIENDTGGLYILNDETIIKNNANTKTSLYANANDSVSLYFNNSKKFETTTTGAKVTGALEVTQEYPTIRPALDLNFAATKTLDRRITFTRDSLGTYIGDDGLLKYASNNVPRFDHDPDTRESLGLLMEQQITNLISGAGGYGSDIRNGTNIGNAPTSSVVDGITLPDGTVGKVRRIQIHPSGNSGMRWGSTGGGNANTPYSASVWARATSGTATAIIDVNDIGNIAYNLTEEWVRMTVTGTATAAYQFMDVVGSVGHDFYLWGFQLENNGIVTSYIPVASNESNKTRAQDLASITGANFTDFYNETEGTLFASGSVSYLPTQNQAFVALENTGNFANQFVAIGYGVGGGGSGYAGGWYVDNGSTSAFANHNAGITADTEFRQSFAYKANDFAGSINGGTPQTDNSGTINTLELDRLRFGYYHYGIVKRAHIKQVKYFKKRLPNAQLQGLTQQ